MTRTVPTATNESFFEACDAFSSTIRLDEVRARWGDPSCLTGYSIGGIAGHVVSMLRYVSDSLAQPAPEGPSPLPLSTAYAGDRYAELAESTHDFLILLGEEEAKQGLDHLRSELARLLDNLERQLPVADPDRPIGVTVMRLEDYLRTRIVEIVVHTDDIAASAGVSPSLRDTASQQVLHVLGEVADPEVLLNAIRVLARPERADASPRGVFDAD